MKTKVRTIKQKVVIPASPKEVYEAYVDAKKHSKFTGSKATGKAVVGGKFTAWTGTFLGKTLSLTMENVWFKSGLRRIGQKVMVLQD
jgi:uncharacterized protein YndB with AHSA1/START domain